MNNKKKIARPPTAQATWPPLRRVGAAALLALVLAVPAAWAQGQAADGGHVRGRIVVMAKAGLSAADLARVLQPHGGRARAIGHTGLHIVDLPAAASEVAVARLLARHPALKFAEPDRRFAPAASFNDPYLGSAWHLARINAPAAWDRTLGAGVTIAILDSGVDTTHPDLAAQLLAGWNFVDGNSNVADVTGHGTAVAGAAAASSNNGTGVASVAGAARILPLRVADSSGYATGSAIAQALSHAADRGARVANISYHGVVGNPTVQAAAQYMKGKGGLVLVAAGNTGSDLGLPAETAMIPVSATVSADTLAGFSSFGRFVGVAAPGDGIWTTQRGGAYGAWWGTSVASPVAAGVVALMMSARPDLPAGQIESLLYASAADLGAPGRDAYYGYGRVDSAAAVAAALAAVAAPAADTLPPSVRVDSPAAGGIVAGLLAVDVSASDNVGVSRVELRVNGAVVAVDTASPYQFSWNSSAVANGSHAIDAVAHDAAGLSRMSERVWLTVANGVVADIKPPVVQFTSPGAGALISGSVTVAVSAADDAGAAGLRNSLWINGVQVASSTGGSLSYRWNTRKLRPGSYTLMAVSQDAAGNKSSISIGVRH